jgi:GAF domain-containing protein
MACPRCPCHRRPVADDAARDAQSRGLPSAQNTGSARANDLSRRLSELARDLQALDDPQDLIDRLVATVVTTVPGAEEASVSLAYGRRRVVSAAATSELPRRFDDLQQETGQGPCMDSMYEHRTVRVEDLASDGRWPELARRATELGVSSMLCFQLFVVGEDMGAFNLLARRPRAFTDESEQVGLLFAAHAAVAVAGAQKLQHVTVALGRRDVIGQAKGILMERFHITADQAFAMIAQVSQETNRKLHDVAEDLALTGALGAGSRGTSEP